MRRVQVLLTMVHCTKCRGKVCVHRRELRSYRDMDAPKTSAYLDYRQEGL